MKKKKKIKSPKTYTTLMKAAKDALCIRAKVGICCNSILKNSQLQI